jgi:hypothetical protein
MCGNAGGRAWAPVDYQQAMLGRCMYACIITPPSALHHITSCMVHKGGTGLWLHVVLVGNAGQGRGVRPCTACLGTRWVCVQSGGGAASTTAILGFRVCQGGPGLRPGPVLACLQGQCVWPSKRLSALWLQAPTINKLATRPLVATRRPPAGKHIVMVHRAPQCCPQRFCDLIHSSSLLPEMQSSVLGREAQHRTVQP